MTIWTGASGEEAALPFTLYDTNTGAEISGYLGSFLAGDGQIRLVGGTFANWTPGQIVEWGNGTYAYQLTALQNVNPGQVGLRVQTAASILFKQWYPVVRSPWGRLLTAEVTAGTFGELAQVIAGAHKHNALLDNCSYNSAGLLVSARLRSWSSAGGVAAATPGAGDGTEGEQYRWIIAAVDSGGGTPNGRPSSFRMTRQL